MNRRKFFAEVEPPRCSVRPAPDTLETCANDKTSSRALDSAARCLPTTTVSQRNLVRAARLW